VPGPVPPPSPRHAAATAGFHTFVVGIATTKESATKSSTIWRSRGSRRGRAESLPSATTCEHKDELIWAFSTITAVVATCAFPLAKPAPDRTRERVRRDRVEANAIPRDETNSDGWNYVAATTRRSSSSFGLRARGSPERPGDYVCPGDVVY